MNVLFPIYLQIRQVSLGEYLRKMGRRNRNVNKFAQRKRDRKEQANNPQPEGDTRKPYEDIVRANAAFDEYYKVQNICPEEEWPSFMKALTKDLPTAFRVTGSKCEAEALMNIVKSKFFSELVNMNLKVEGKEDEEEIKPFNLPWYPGGLAWQLRLSRTDIRRNEMLYKLHNFLVAETAAGGVSRQETVSMIPPVVLDVQPHHKVLDMCAAPGSKTAQLIEFLHADEEKLPTGFVMANDVDNSRCYMLVHQAKRLNSPAILITNHDSSLMPSLDIADETDPNKTVPLKFDRVLCDVPCSGDGTLRKNPDIWTKWTPGNGSNLHGVQYRILRRGCELLAVGGRLVYSTCSFNPLENEAVIHRLLQETEGMKLVDGSKMLPGLKYKKGMTYWKPASKDMVFYEKPEDVPEKWQTTVRPQMFPPKAEDLHKYNLELCMRVLPHHQDTGGFFIAVLEKVAALPFEKKEAERKAEKETQQEDEKKEPPKKKRRMHGYREDPFVFFPPDEEDVFPSIKAFYELNSAFDSTCLLTRCLVGKKKNIYLTTSAVRDVVRRNEGSIKIINTGVKTFVRCDNKNMTCAFRLSQEGLHSILPYAGQTRRVRILRDDLILVLQCDNPSKPPDLSQFTEETQAQVKNLAPGSCILEYQDSCSSLQLTLVGWRGVNSLRAYTCTADTVHYLRMLGADYSKYDVNKFNKKATESAAADDDTSQTSDHTEVSQSSASTQESQPSANGDVVAAAEDNGDVTATAKDGAMEVESTSSS